MLKLQRYVPRFEVLIIALSATAGAAAKIDVPEVTIHYPRTLTCSMTAAVKTAFGQQGLRVQVEATDGPARVQIRQGSEVELTRELGHSRTCQVLAKTAVAMVRRFLEDIHWNGSVIQVPPQETPRIPEPSPVVSEVVLDAGPVPIEKEFALPDAGIVEVPVSRLDAGIASLPLDFSPHEPGVALGSHLWLGVPGALALAPSLDLSLRFGRLFRIALAATAALPTTIPVVIQNRERGVLSVFAMLASVKVTLSWSFNTLELSPGIEAGALVSAASASGNLFGITGALDASPAVGLVARGAWKLPYGFALYAEVRPLALPISRQYVIEGTPASFATPHLLLVAGGGVEWTLNVGNHKSFSAQ